jgi:hypothetical protein
MKNSGVKIPARPPSASARPLASSSRATLTVPLSGLARLIRDYMRGLLYVPITLSTRESKLDRPERSAAQEPQIISAVS